MKSLFQVLLEYQNPLDSRHYGGWITAEKEIHYVDKYQHSAYAFSNFGLTSYGKLFAKGYVRFVFSRSGDRTPYSIGVEGYIDNVIKTRSLWWPSFQEFGKIYLDTATEIKNGDLAVGKRAREFNWEERSQIIPWLHEMKEREPTPPQDLLKSLSNSVTEGIDELSSVGYGGWIAPDFKIHKVPDEDHVGYALRTFPEMTDHPGSISPGSAYSNRLPHDDITYEVISSGYVRFVIEDFSIDIEGHIDDVLRTRSLWWPAFQNLGHIRLDIFKKKNKKQRTVSGYHSMYFSWYDKNYVLKWLQDQKAQSIVIENFKPSRFIQVKKRLIELNSHWTNYENKKVPAMNVYSDGRKVGKIIEISEKQFKAGEDVFTTVEEAIASLITIKRPGIRKTSIDFNFRL